MRRLAPLTALFLLSIPAIAARQVALLTEGALAPPAMHGLAKLGDALRADPRVFVIGEDVGGAYGNAFLLLRPLLKAWLDEHLPNIVQAKVEQEVERIARGRVR